MKVSVIIPIYGVEAFIERSVRSLMEQTLEDVEYIFVDDCTRDRSIEILNQIIALYPARRENVHIIHHNVNKGLPAARNTGLAMAQGEYVFHCDGDDWVEPDILELLYYAAVKKNADYVWCDFFLSFSDNERIMTAKDFSTQDDLIRHGFLSGSMKYNVWNKLVRRSLYTSTGILFPEDHSMGEDMTVIKLAMFAESVAYVPKALYHYVKINANAYTNTMSDKHLVDIKYNTDSICAFVEEKCPGIYTREIEFFKQSVKLPFLFSKDKMLFKVWQEWYPESNKYILQNKQLPLRTRVVQYCASMNLFFLVRIYNWVVNTIIYGVIYK